MSICLDEELYSVFLSNVQRFLRPFVEFRSCFIDILRLIVKVFLILNKALMENVFA